MKAKSQHPWTHGQADSNAVLMTPRADTDHFPYRRFYRGKHNVDVPSVHTRRAGYAPRLDELYKPPKASEQRSPYLNLRDDLVFSKPYTDTLFQTSCCQAYPSFQKDSRDPHTLQGYSRHIPITSVMNR